METEGTTAFPRYRSSPRSVASWGIKIDLVENRHGYSSVRFGAPPPQGPFFGVYQSDRRLFFEACARQKIPPGPPTEKGNIFGLDSGGGNVDMRASHIPLYILCTMVSVRCPSVKADGGASDWPPACERARMAVVTAFSRHAVSLPGKWRVFPRRAASNAKVLSGAKKPG